MGCSSCSTNKNSSPNGCKNNGTCGTSGCNKLNVYNWLADMVLPEGKKPYDIAEVRFKGSRKEFFKNRDGIEIKEGDVVAVEGTPGHDIGVISLTGELVKLQMQRRGVAEDSIEVKTLYRHARQPDIEKWDAVKKQEHPTMHQARKIALALNLTMKLSDVEFQGDGKKATFYYTAEGRVDFRELIKRLADEFKIRVEMKQIGLRQEASRLGGIGSCGRELCCSTWLTDFKVVQTSAARYQNLSLNPIKLAGQCGKLKCCLNYELDGYLEAIKDIPDSEIRLFTAKGTGVHEKTDIFKRLMWYSFKADRRPDGEEEFQSPEWIMLSVDRVKEVIELNKQNIKPADLRDFAEVEEVSSEPTHYADVVGQDSITRMDQHKRKKKKHKNRNRQSPQNQQSQQQNAGGRQQGGRGGQGGK